MDTFYVNLWDDFFNGNGLSYDLGSHVSCAEAEGRFISSDLSGFAICW